MKEEIIFVISDLILKSRIQETLGIYYQNLLFAKNLEQIEAIISKQNISLIVLDLNLKGDSLIDELEYSLYLLKSCTEKFPQIKVIAFGSHVNTSLLAQASELGAYKVLPYSGLVKWLEQERIKVQASGASWLSIFVFVGILSAITWYLFQLIPIYYRYYELENAMRSLSKVAFELNDKELRKRMISQMREIGIPGDINEVRISRANQTAQIEYDYYESIDINWGDKTWTIQEFEFSLNIQEDNS